MTLHHTMSALPATLVNVSITVQAPRNQGSRQPRTSTSSLPSEAAAFKIALLREVISKTLMKLCFRILANAAAVAQLLQCLVAHSAGTRTLALQRTFFSLWLAQTQRALASRSGVPAFQQRRFTSILSSCTSHHAIMCIGRQLCISCLL
jgi:hypothetical protein